MGNRMQKFGDGIRIDTQQEYIGNEWVDVDTINVDLNVDGYAVGKLPITNIDTNMCIPGQILVAGNCGSLEWKNPSEVFEMEDRELREQYPSLEIAWKNVLEAIHEYEMVKKLVKDY